MNSLDTLLTAGRLVAVRELRVAMLLLRQLADLLTVLAMLYHLITQIFLNFFL